MAQINLAQLEWTLEGWRPYCWRFGSIVTPTPVLKPDLGPFEAHIPCSVQETLLRAGVLPDWHVGVNSRLCEWVEHRHWAFRTTIPAGLVPRGERVRLNAQGLDYSGWLIVDGAEAGRFEGALITHAFDLGHRLSDGNAHALAIVFEEPPREQGEIGFTSQSRHFKPRYNYSWDWCPRFVPIGIWDALTLETGAAAAVSLRCVCATLDDDNRTGHVEAHIECCGNEPGANKVAVALRDGEREIARTEQDIRDSGAKLLLDAISVEPWWPNGEGPAKTYTLEARATDETGKVAWSEQRTIGFRRIEWRPCEGAPKDARPWLCVVNGKPVFLQGFNWTPVRLGYHDTTDAEYTKLIDMYEDMGCNLFRVWGGAILEKEAFYEACDRAGILVWQEFPLSSSALENAPPDDPTVIENLTRIASSYIRRRAHHPSLLLWCGGNELRVGSDGLNAASGTPVDESHPCIAALKAVVEREDPGRRFLPTTPSGPRFLADAGDFGKGLHHAVNGPYGMTGFQNIEAWRAYWENDDALLRSEVAMPGAAPFDLIKQFAGGMQTWPPEGEYWQHTAAWWIQWDEVKEAVAGLEGDAALKEYVHFTQQLQAETYEIAAACSRRRFPKCGGFIIWMGHDCFPCPANNAVIDFLHNPKPAFDAIKRAFTDQQ